MVIEKSGDFYDAYSENCDGIYAAGENIDAVKADTVKAITLIKQELPKEQWPAQLKAEYEIQYKLDTQSFLEYYKGIISLAGLEKITGINQKQLSNYLNNHAKLRKKQTGRINEGIHRFANELLNITL